MSLFQTTHRPVPQGARLHGKECIPNTHVIDSISFSEFPHWAVDASMLPQRGGPKMQGFLPRNFLSFPQAVLGAVQSRAHARTRNSRPPTVIHWLLISQLVTHPGSKMNFYLHQIFEEEPRRTEWHEEKKGGRGEKKEITWSLACFRADWASSRNSETRSSVRSRMTTAVQLSWLLSCWTRLCEDTKSCKVFSLPIESSGLR